MNIVILAAGQGKRMYSALPKVLHPIAGKPMLGHVLDTVQKMDSTVKPCIVLGHGQEAVKAYLNKNHSNFTIAIQAEQQGTGHAVMQALPYLNEDASTLILYGDVPLIQASTLKDLLLLAQDETLVILTQELENPTGYGRIVKSLEGDVTGIVEEKDATVEVKQVREINTGMMACPTKELRQWLSQIQPNNAQGEYYLTDIVGLAAGQGLPIRTMMPQYGFEVEGVNSRVQLAALERTWQTHQAEELLLKGVTLIDPQRIDIRGDFNCSNDVTIDIGCIFEGQVEIAGNVHIGPYCVIKDSKIGPHTQIKAFSHLDGAVVGESAVIGPYARLRPGTEIDEQAHIGNFVEVKNSRIGKGSKANHLSYIGDAQVGSRVNIGAGTITCNYDGVNKHQTIIEDDAFIGSDTQLVAPVTVGKGATIGAGTTLTKNAPEDKLTISRAKQLSVEWKRPQKK
ncbi:bifunctional protein GlmU [Polynucleobacter sp. SHI8]|uniref:bifunctional UDP-N-acetylglucosamine diphosphorylase/glucosamine-1-phosphate N-acetyltransferase GlmU n=1 Tax=unclassified Polynucleobacter TaxID=2640945 RepID=UPI0024919564|nr:MULTISPECIES: bifunctional UDP-N-acetylglucosamine diphosphorylase/glucosamine-1-phosphate N-acetyltransferase GlmU [unclassified Polynucleobacter]BDW12202.1 bifunctional protein GlmU [Polynucleobacter sp. SHI2]BDW14650.1 bifunctional protein GlmU [Polynucleobacter sp. SHI8]